MSYNNDYSYSGGQPWGGYGNSQRAPYNLNYNRYGNTGMRSYQGDQTARKRSGAKIKIIDGNPFVSAWRKNAKGFYALYARPYKGTKDISSKSGKNWLNLFVTITNRTTMQKQNCSGMYDVDRKRLYIKEFNQIVTLNGRGGYWGKHLGNNNNRRY
jgi:hypothetical protein